MLDRLRLRTRQLHDIWKPVGLASSGYWVYRAAKNFWSHTGPFSMLILAFLAFVLVILFTVPIKSVQLLAKRTVASLLDFTLLAVFTVGVMHLLFQGNVVEPSAIVSMAIVWAWFFLFVLADWRLKGTPGQLMLGLRLRKADKGDSGFVKCLARNLLTLLVPIVAAGQLLAIPLTYSRLEAILRTCAGFVLLAIVPLSIVFTGGQTLPDLLLGMTVLPRRSGLNQFPSWLDKRRWAFLFLASVVTGVILAFATRLQSELARKPPVAPLSQTFQSESQVSAWLWPRLEAGIPSPDLFVQNVRAFSERGSLSSNAYEALQSTRCSGAPEAVGNVLLVEVQVRILTPTSYKGVLYKNLADTFSTEVPPSKRPAFLLFDVLTREGFGAFTLTTEEESALCMAQADGKPLNTFVIAGESARVTGSVSELSALCLGNLEVYSYIEKLPIWSH